MRRVYSINIYLNFTFSVNFTLFNLKKSQFIETVALYYIILFKKKNKKKLISLI